MKKWYRIGICLVLAICLLLLPACGSKQSLSETGGSQMQPSETAKSEKLVWSSKTLDTFAGLRSKYSQERTIDRLTYGAWQGMVLTNQEMHRNCANIGHCELDGNSPCGVVEYLESTNCNEEYFTENTLLVITLQVDANNPAVLKDVQYTDGILTCFVELGKPIRRMLTARKTLYVQIETALPENTEVKLEITSKAQTESELVLQWEESYLYLPGTWKLWERDAPKIAKLLNWESYQAFVEECASHGSTCPTYTEEFFGDHSLIVLGLSSGSGSTIYELYDLHYAQGVLTCFVDSPFAKDVLGTANMASWLCFIEVDTVLPENTSIVSDEGAVLYDYDTYLQKHEQFRNLDIINQHIKD